MRWPEPTATSLQAAPTGLKAELLDVAAERVEKVRHELEALPLAGEMMRQDVVIHAALILVRRPAGSRD